MQGMASTIPSLYSSPNCLLSQEDEVAAKKRAKNRRKKARKKEREDARWLGARLTAGEITYQDHLTHVCPSHL